MIRVLVSVPVRPTDDRTKVERALSNLFPDLHVEATPEGLRGETTGLERLGELIRNQRIRDTARSVLLRGRTAGRTRFELNKQAAYMGRVSFGATSPLGDILVEIQAEDLDAAIDVVAESTVRPKTMTSSRNARR